MTYRWCWVSVRSRHVEQRNQLTLSLTHRCKQGHFDDKSGQFVKVDASYSPDGTRDACFEIDLIEGNKKAVQATLHTTQGKGIDGRCNQDGCHGNWGQSSSTMYGALPGAEFNSLLPFRVTARFPKQPVKCAIDQDIIVSYACIRSRPSMCVARHARR